MQNLTFSLGVTVLGMLTVFVGLAILIAFITVLGKLTSRGGQKKAAPAPVEAPAAPTAEPAQQAEEGISPEVIAAITAAVAMVWQGDTGFTVRHVRRIGNAPAWARAGREEQTYSRF